MKKNSIKSIFISLTLIIMSVIAIQPAQASCSEQDPCGTWALVDPNGTVINILVCQESFCGSSGTSGGTDGNGNRFVKQVAPNPVTHDTKNTGGALTINDKPVTENNGVFTITNPNPRYATEVIDTPQNSTIIETVIDKGGPQTFTYESTVEDPTTIDFKDEILTEDSSAHISIKDTNKVTGATTTVKGDFETRLTEVQLEEELKNDNSSSNQIEVIDRVWSKIKSMLWIWII